MQCVLYDFSKALYSNSHMNTIIPLKYSPRFDIQNINLWIHFWNASGVADLCIPLKCWLIADPRACLDFKRRPNKKICFRKKKKSHGAGFGKYGSCGIPQDCTLRLQKLFYNSTISFYLRLTRNYWIYSSASKVKKFRNFLQYSQPVSQLCYNCYSGRQLTLLKWL